MNKNYKKISLIGLNLKFNFYLINKDKSEYNIFFFKLLNKNIIFEF